MDNPDIGALWMFSPWTNCRLSHQRYQPSVILSQIPIDLHTTFARSQVNITCLMSSIPFWHAGHPPVLLMCRLARTTLHGMKQWRALQPKILILPGRFNFHNCFHAWLLLAPLATSKFLAHIYFFIAMISWFHREHPVPIIMPCNTVISSRGEWDLQDQVCINWPKNQLHQVDVHWISIV